jgi:APA family basic amino acid/polyamine antiporter
LIALALLTSVSAMIMVAPRVYAKMADDGVFPRWLRFEGEVPAASVWAQALLASVLVWIAGLRELLSYLGFTLGLSTAAAIASLYFVTHRRRDLPPLPGYPWAPATYVVCTLVFATLGAIQSPAEMLAAILTIVSGVALYFLVAGRKEFP